MPRNMKDPLVDALSATEEPVMGDMPNDPGMGKGPEGSDGAHRHTYLEERIQALEDKVFKSKKSSPASPAVPAAPAPVMR